MLACSKRQGEHSYKMMAGGLTVFVMVCSFIFSGCGTVPLDQPLTASMDTPVDQGSPKVSSGSEIAPIELINSQTNLRAYPGGYMTMTISTSPYAISNFVVNYGLSTPDKATGNIPRTVDTNGIASWRWQVALGAHTGIWPLTISAILPNGSRTTKQVNVTVILAPINVVSSQSTLSNFPNGNMTLTIATAPQVTCTLLLNYGPGIPRRTLLRKADSNGMASWTWGVENKAAVGTWPLTVTVRLLDGESNSSQVNITIL